MNKYDAMTQTEFDNILMDILNDTRINQIIDIPGIYEILSEEFNNEILDIWEQKQEIKKEI